jgi:hypothetical protein
MGDGDMAYPPFVCYGTEIEYRNHFERVYCQQHIITFDGISVRFRKNCFDHSFYESSKRNKIKDKFSDQRAKRIDWIKATLQDPKAELYIGWDGTRKRYDKSHRVAVVVANYVVVIRVSGDKTAQFVTAYVADSVSTLDKIKKSPRWGF